MRIGAQDASPGRRWWSWCLPDDRDRHALGDRLGLGVAEVGDLVGLLPREPEGRQPERRRTVLEALAPCLATSGHGHLAGDREPDLAERHLQHGPGVPTVD